MGQIPIDPQPNNRKFNEPITVTVTYTYAPFTPVIGGIFLAAIDLVTSGNRAASDTVIT